MSAGQQVKDVDIKPWGYGEIRRERGNSMDYPLYQNPKVEKSAGSYGRWVVKTSDVTFRFFWNRETAESFARSAALIATPDSRLEASR